MDLYAGGIPLCPDRIREVPRDDGREICVGMDQERDSHAEISGVPVRKSYYELTKDKIRKQEKEARKADVKNTKKRYAARSGEV